MLKNINKCNLYLLILFIGFYASFQPVFSQDLIEDASSNFAIGDNETLFSETINIISRSGKIFILTNSNQLLSKGDFITLVVKDSGPVARAVVAKTFEGQAGIKVIKVYSLTRWGQVRKNLVVDIKKGDDSSLFLKKKPKEELANKDNSIESEEDLFNEKALIDEDLTDFYKDNRHIKPDNIVTIGYNQLTFKEETANVSNGTTGGDTIAGNQFNYSWGYQFSDNYWVEGLYGRAQIDGFPASGNQTIINNLTVRLKYTFKAPLYSYAMPYIGIKTVSVSSPDAGVAETASSDDIATAAAEQKTIDDLQQTQLVVGVTILRRLVPGWFLKLDLGTDIVSVGFGIEF